MAISDFYQDGIIIQRQSAGVSNGMGGNTGAWATHLTISGLIDQVSGSEKYIAAQYATSATHYLICDTGYDVTSKDRVLANSKKYRILNVDEPFNHHAEILLAYEGVDQ
jgi:SPP1 family predicted phage head-tail adaptor